MKKLSLDLQELAVETFATAVVAEERGTVQGQGVFTQLKTNCTQCMSFCIESCMATC
jgi:hypothetical protein